MIFLVLVLITIYLIYTGVTMKSYRITVDYGFGIQERRQFSCSPADLRQVMSDIQNEKGVFFAQDCVEVK